MKQNETTNRSETMNAAATTNPAVKGEKRHIMVGPGRFELCECIMVLGMSFDPITGRSEREVLWEQPSGRSIQGSAHENWV